MQIELFLSSKEWLNLQPLILSTRSSGANTNTKMKLSVIKVHLQNNQDHNHLKLLQTSDIREAGRGRGSNRNQVSLEFLQLVFDFSTDFFPGFQEISQ